MTDVLVIQHQAAEGAGTILEEIRTSGRGVHLLRIDQEEPVPSSPGAWKAVVVMGGTMGVYDQAERPHLREEIALLKLFLREDKPILGICLGAQLLAAALDSEVKPGVTEIGWVPVRKMPEAFKDPVLRRLPESFPALMWHGDHFALPKGAVHLLSTDQCACAGFRYGKKAYGLVPHLEMNAAMVDEMVATSRKELVAAGVEPAQILEAASEHAETVEELARIMWRAWVAFVS